MLVDIRRSVLRGSRSNLRCTRALSASSPFSSLLIKFCRNIAKYREIRPARSFNIRDSVLGFFHSAPAVANVVNTAIPLFLLPTNVPKYTRGQPTQPTTPEPGVGVQPHAGPKARRLKGRYKSGQVVLRRDDWVTRLQSAVAAKNSRRGSSKVLQTYDAAAHAATTSDGA
jgi:hypothetical protein